MLYQLQNSYLKDGLKVEVGCDFSFPAHLHDSFEIIIITEGEMTVNIDGVPYLLREGEGAFVFPDQIHELITSSHSRHFLCIFSSKYVAEYAKATRNTLPDAAVFTPSESTARRLLSLKSSDGIYKIKGLLYELCAEFDEGREYHKRRATADGILSKIFEFVEESYRSDCTLSALSGKLGYSYVYLSKHFKERIGISFTEYVNRYRINEACYLLRRESSSVIKIAYECGYDSLRSFNRNFKAITGVTPTEYSR